MIFIDPRATKPLYEQIKDNLRERILSGILRPGDKLPSVRELAQSTAINPNTIQKAYRDLETEGWIYSVAGRGSYASEAPPALLEKRRNELMQQLRPLLNELRASGLTAANAQSLVSEVWSTPQERTDTP